MDVNKIFKNIESELQRRYEYTKNCHPVVVDASAIITDFNRKYIPPKTNPDTTIIFENFCDEIFSMQATPYFHKLTCGVNSEHAYLVPRITTSGICVLVCPTCGYVQDTMWFFDQKA